MLTDIIEKTAQLESWQVDQINNVVLTNTMPWYFSKDSVYNDNLNYFSHVLIHRKEDNKNHEKNSPLTDFFIEIFKKAVSDSNINLNEILRASLNATFFNDKKFGTVHVDHEFEHSNFIMYLDTIENAGTAIFEKDRSTVKYISDCVKFNYVFFPGDYHAQMFPPPGVRRVVFVVTFR